MDRLLRIGFVVYAALLAVPLRFYAIEPGLDPSWAFALKWFHARGLKFGQDLAFTWGPLGHLAIAMDVNGGLASAVAAQIAAWLIYVVTLAYVAFRQHVALWRLGGFVLFTYVGVRMFHVFGYAGFDFFLSWLVLLLIGCTTLAQRWWIPFGTAILLAGLLMLMKLSTGIAAVSAVLAFPVGSILVNRRRALLAGMAAAAGLPAVFATGYLIHNPSFQALARYIRAGFEISAEHSTILSLPGQPMALYAALALLGCYAALLIVLLITRNAAFAVALAAAGPIFLEFKHSFIREPGHVEMLFLFMPLVAAVFALFMTAPGWGRPASIAIAIGFAAILIYAQRGVLLRSGTGLQYARPLAQVLEWAGLRRHLKQASEINLAHDHLPSELLARVRGRSVTIFPWESSYAAANELDYRPFPVFQSYDAYTPFLDGWNAEFFEDAATAPQFVIFDWAGIDERHPLLDVPQTALALYRHYILDASFGNRLLLRRLSVPRLRSVLGKAREGTIGVGRPLLLNTGSRAALVSLDLKWNLQGALKKFFWRLPEIRWIATFGDGSTLSARVPPAVLAGGVAVDIIPSTAEQMRALYAGEPGRQVQSVVIAGQGAKYLDQSIRYEVSAIEDLSTRPVEPADVRIAAGLRGDCRIDFVDDRAVEAGSVSVNTGKGYITFRGWALSTTDVLVRVDARARRAMLGTDRPDVVAAYRQPAHSRPGFELTMPSAYISASAQTIEILVRNDAGSYQVCAESFQLQVD